MFIHEPFARIKSIKKHEWMGGVVILLSLMALTSYLLSRFGFQQEAAQSEIEIEPSVQVHNTPSLLCDVSGAVNKPGLVAVTSGMRVADAISSAGGLNKDADLQAISTTINLSEKVKDEQKIVVPFKNTAQRVTATSHSLSEKISINTASTSELEKLAGIGPVKAAQIISERPFANVDALVEKKIISQKAFEALSGKISL